MSKVTEYLDSLKWDGTFRIDGFAASECFEHPARAAEALNQFFDDAVRRAREPGCLVIRAMVVCGPQGFGKSQFLRDLGGEGYYAFLGAQDTRSLIEIVTDPSISPWIVGVPGDVLGEAHRAFVGTRVDYARAPYAKFAVERLRTFVPVFTTVGRYNFSRSRRFYSLRVVRPIPLIGTCLRDCLWAEAAARYASRVKSPPNTAPTGG